MAKRDMANSDFHVVLLIVTIIGCTFFFFSLGHCLTFYLRLLITPLVSYNFFNQCEKKCVGARIHFDIIEITSLQIYSFDCLSVSREEGERSSISVGRIDFASVLRFSN